VIGLGVTSPLRSTLIEILAGLAILANAVIYGTDVLGVIVLRPAIAAVDDRTFTQLMGHVHRVADRRIAAISIGGLIAAVAMSAVAAASGHWVSTATAALSTLAVIIFAGVHTRVSKPVNTALTTAATADRVLDDARDLRARWDSVIDLESRAADRRTRRNVRRAGRGLTPTRRTHDRI
jgi:hypothetical protein